ncbi:hypothetical protein M011DRAFT_450395 [Sporormia fimetaria CBS 119925]|uniref:Rhodopsin domain-containing protein n=1 Tax=Sporormia fimetaria CBS 119925 TaxID=1340428 RepID=A0A6A6V2A3_9PLEO|nr:hypothetical protein M011DRAFT_450395 [Sporormia fimetaria CBS 119925]
MSGLGPPPSAELIAYSNADVLIAEAATLFSVAALTVVLRCYVRIHMLKAFGHDDWTMVLALLLAAATLACYVLQVPLGLGKHLSVIQMDPDKYRQLLKVRYVHQNVCGPAVTIVKISVAFFLLRFARQKAYVWFLRGLIVFLVALLLACAGTLIWACIPVAASWDFRLRPPPLGTGTAKCFSKKTFGEIALFNAVTNCFTDFLLALLPIPLIWKLQVNMRTRVTLVLILSLGIFAGIAGVIRATVFNSILNDPRRFIHEKYSMWNYVELTVGIIAGSLPALKPLFGAVLNVAKGMTTGSRSKDGKSGYGYGKSAPESLGYIKQGGEIRVNTEVRLRELKTSGTPWGAKRGADSEESIAPLYELRTSVLGNSGDRAGGRV